MSQAEHENSPCADRRTVLALGLGSAGLCLAGCGRDAGAPAPPDGGSDEPRGGGLPLPGPEARSGAAGTVLGPAAAVPVGGGTVYPALEVVVTQPEPGRFLGFSAVCTHTGCIVATVTDGTIHCPCHGSRYRLDGSVAEGPAPRPLPVRAVRVNNAQIVLI